jgi:transcriptional regulator with XRE-family HTH domain
MSQPRYEVSGDDDVDDLEADIDEEERERPGTRARMEQLMPVIRMTTRLWQQREAIGMTIEEAAERSGLTLNEIESVEDNSVDITFDVLCRYAGAVGLRFVLQPTPAAPPPAVKYDLWVDYHRSDGEGLTHTHVDDVETDIELVPGDFVVVGNQEADSAVAEVVSIEPDGLVLVRVLPGPAEDHLHLTRHGSGST